MIPPHLLNNTLLHNASIGDWSNVANIAMFLGIGTLIPVVFGTVSKVVKTAIKYLFFIDKVQAENKDLKLNTEELKFKLSFVETAKDEFKSFVEDLQIRADILNKELDECQAKLSIFQVKLNDLKSNNQLLMDNFDKAYNWGRLLFNQLILSGIKPASEEPGFNKLTEEDATHEHRI